jgi:hypothetical protein
MYRYNSIITIFSDVYLQSLRGNDIFISNKVQSNNYFKILFIETWCKSSFQIKTMICWFLNQCSGMLSARPFILFPIGISKFISSLNYIMAIVKTWVLSSINYSVKGIEKKILVFLTQTVSNLFQANHSLDFFRRNII